MSLWKKIDTAMGITSIILALSILFHPFWLRDLMEAPTLLGTVGNRVVIRKVDSETKLKSGIVLAETQNTQIVFGEVYSIGKRVEELRSGDRVLFHLGTANEIFVKGEIFYVVRESDILATARSAAPAE